MSDGLKGGVSTFLNGGRPDGRRRTAATQSGSSNLADLLERVLDKGLIIAGDITLCLGELELLQIKIRLLVASVDKAREMGIDWWQHDPALSSAARKGVDDRDALLQRLDRLETMLGPLVGEREAQVTAQGSDLVQQLPERRKLTEPSPTMDVLIRIPGCGVLPM
jgi:hypothetical protein